MDGAESKKGPLTLDELLVSDRDDLTTLGLIGIVDTLDNVYRVRDEKVRSDTVQAIARATFRGLAEAMHPDKRSSDSFSEDAFQIASDALKNINSDPGAAIAAIEIASNGQDAEIQRRGNIIQALGNKVQDQRRLLAESLYGMHYDKMFPRENDEPISLGLKPYSFNQPNLIDHGVMERILNVKIVGDKLIYAGVTLVPGEVASEEELDESGFNPEYANTEKPDRREEHHKLVVESEELAQSILPKLRIIGAIKRQDLNGQAAVTERIKEQINHPFNTNINPLEYISSDPGKYNDIDLIRPVIDLAKYKDFTLVLAMRDEKSQDLVVGPFGEIESVN